MIDWNSDAEFHQLKLEFIQSLPERLANLKFFREKLTIESFNPSDVQGVCMIVHKLAGSAASFQFIALGRIAEKLEDWLEVAKISEHFPKQVIRYLTLLEEAISWTIRSNQDSIDLLTDPRMRELISFVETLPD